MQRKLCTALWTKRNNHRRGRHFGWLQLIAASKMKVEADVEIEGKYEIQVGFKKCIIKSHYVYLLSCFKSVLKKNKKLGFLGHSFCTMAGVHDAKHTPGK